jgi:Cys-tRNA(Pro)/Cys-tRNA(Cys) deacylase
MTPALVAAEHAGVDFRLHEYDVDTAQGPTFGAAAAAALGVEPERMYKTLITKVDGRQLCVAVVSVAGELDLKALAQAAGGKRAALAETTEAEKATGYVVGGISPLGHRRRMTVVVDESALDHDSIYFNGGRRGLQLEMAPADLLVAARAIRARIART